MIRDFDGQFFNGEIRLKLSGRVGQGSHCFDDGVRHDINILHGRRNEGGLLTKWKSWCAKVYGGPKVVCDIIECKCLLLFLGGIPFRLDALLLQTLSIGDGMQILITDLIGVDALLLLGKSLCLKTLDIGFLFSLDALSFKPFGISLLVGEALFFSKFGLLSCRLYQSVSINKRAQG